MLDVTTHTSSALVFTFAPGKGYKTQYSPSIWEQGNNQAKYYHKPSGMNSTPESSPRHMHD